MKKVLSVVLVAAMATLFACGPSAEEKAAKEKAKQDSIAKAQREQAIADSIAQARQKQIEDSIANAKRIADSIAAAEAKKKTGTKKSGTTTTTPKDKVKAGQGKG